MPNALVITAAGINCDLELARAFELAGASSEEVHLSRLMQKPEILDEFALIGLPGGFSYGDALGAGRIAAQLMRQSLYPAFVRAVERGTPIIAPCNGFQIAVQLGLLPGPTNDCPWPSEPPRPTVALTSNMSARFADRWCEVEIPANTRCIWTADLEAGATTRLLPIAHGEGRFIPESEELLAQLEANGQIALRYAPHDNPNGSAGDVAGICDASGLVFGLMPHPERYTQWTHHPFWTRLSNEETEGEPLGMQIFRNAVQHVLDRESAAATAAADAAYARAGR